MMDVSHEKAIEEALQASKDRFEQMAATVPSGLYEYVIHADGTSEYLYLSSRAEEIYEVNPGELQNDINLLWDMVHPDDIEFLRGTDIDCNRRGELFTCEFRILTRSGKLKWLKLASLPNPASPGQPAIWSGYVIDITDQKLIENKIKANEATLRQILDHSPVAIASASLDANPRITYLNQTFIGTFGYTLADIPTVERWGQLAYPDPEYRKRTFDWWNDAVERGRNNDGSVETGEFRVVRKDNAILDVLIGATLVADAMIVTLIDITERKKAESHLAIAREELTRQKIESSILQERQRLIEDLHDGFGSQLTSARLKVDEGLMDQADLSEILRECLSDLHLVVDTVNSPQITLNEAIRSLRERYQRRLSGRAPQLHWDLELEGILPLPHREALTLLRIIQEALNNALKHAQASKIRIEAIYEPGGELAISIQDDGIGLPAQLAYGKGLHNMRSRAESLGGALTIGNDRPTGTRVALRLTLKTDSETEGR
jgi:PAS domain S-box-containing protein